MSRNQITIRRVDDPDPDGVHVQGTVAERLGMMWQLARDAWAFSGRAADAESRLQRHLIRIHRR